MTKLSCAAIRKMTSHFVLYISDMFFLMAAQLNLVVIPQLYLTTLKSYYTTESRPS